MTSPITVRATPAPKEPGGVSCESLERREWIKVPVTYLIFRAVNRYAERCSERRFTFSTTEFEEPCRDKF